MNYDQVVIGVLYKEVAEEIHKTLVEKGVPKQKKFMGAAGEEIIILVTYITGRLKDNCVQWE